VRLYARAQPDLDAFPGAEVRVIPFPRLWTHLRLSWEMALRPPDLLFVPAHVLPLARPRRTLVTVHDLGYRRFPGAHPPRQRRYLELSTRWNARVASHVLADSQATRDDLVAAYGVPAGKVTVAYPGYDADLAPVRDPQALARVRERYAIAAPYVLFLGSIQPRKNLARLVRAFARVLDRHPELTLVLAGKEGWLAQPIHAQVDELGLVERVRFTGYVAEEDKAALLSGACLFAFPSLHEGFGFPVLEAQACGAPVLTSATSSLPEVAGNGALLVDPEEEEDIARGMVRILDDEALRRRLVAAGFHNLERFSWEGTAKVVAGIMESLLGFIPKNIPNDLG
jgi:glycosyltransferase involved in cell wall biosynthesis